MWSLVLVSCARPTLPDPEVVRVEPSFAWNGESTAITLVGSDFFPEIDVDARVGDASVNPTYTAWLRGPAGAAASVPLLGVTILDAEHLTATVPAGLAPGVYSVGVENPGDGRGTLPGGFRVTDQRAARLVLDTPRFVYSIAEQAAMSVSLLDVEDQVVALPLEVAVVATSESGEVVMERGTLTGAVPTPDGDGLRGTLVDGRATVSLSPELPGRVEVTVVPWDPASAVVGDRLVVDFEPGSDLSVVLELPTDTVFRAGEPFSVLARVVDQYGNPVLDPTPVSLRTTCSGWFASTVLVGDTAVAVTPTLASTPACEQDRVAVVEPASLSGESDPYLVLPGPAARLSVFVAPASLRAGDLLNVLVVPEDLFGNRTSWAAELTLEDSLGGLIEPSCVVVADNRVCTARPTLASPEVAVRARGDDGVVGVSEAFEVLPDDVVAGLRLVTAGEAVAGAPMPAVVEALDTWGNRVPADDFPADAFGVHDELGDGVCVRTGTSVDGGATFDCTFTLARTGTLTATFDAFAVDVPFTVHNGPLARVAVSAPPAATAGQPVTVVFDGFDAWDNPTLVLADPRVDLADAGGSFDVAAAVLDGSGHAEVSGAFTLAGVTSVSASQAGVVLGRSADVSVSPASTTALRVTPAEPWAYVDEPATVTVESVDPFGNRTGLDASGLLTSRTTTASDAAVGLVNGVGSTVFTWPQAGLPDTLDASAGGFVGSVALAVVRRCPGGPTAALSFAGFADGVACAGVSGRGDLVADLTGSVPGALALANYAATVGDAVAALEPSGIATLTLAGLGRHEVRGLAIDTAGCGAETIGAGWLGPDDGTPTGPIALTTAAPSLAVFGATTVDLVGATDCARDPASFQDVYLSTSGGILSGANPTGAGLAVALDANGDASTPLTTAAGGLSSTTLRIVASVDSGAARGEVALPLTGDNVRPVVLDAMPTGSGTDLVSTFVLLFSEPLLTNALTPVNFSVAGATVSQVTAVGPEVTLELAAPVDGALGPVALTATTGVRDVAGNRLAGDWGTAAAPWQSSYGGTAVGPGTPSCDEVVPSTLRFRPDGDDGSGEESDTLAISVLADSPPSWWIAEVTDESGALVFTDWSAPVGAADVVRWGGRGFDGAIVPPGRYQVSVSAADGLGNRSGACVTPVVVVGR